MKNRDKSVSNHLVSCLASYGHVLQVSPNDWYRMVDYQTLIYSGQLHHGFVDDPLAGYDFHSPNTFTTP